MARRSPDGCSIVFADGALLGAKLSIAADSRGDGMPRLQATPPPRPPPPPLADVRDNVADAPSNRVSRCWLRRDGTSPRRLACRRRAWEP